MHSTNHNGPAGQPAGFYGTVRENQHNYMRHIPLYPPVKRWVDATHRFPRRVWWMAAVIPQPSPRCPSHRPASDNKISFARLTTCNDTINTTPRQLFSCCNSIRLLPLWGLAREAASPIIGQTFLRQVTTSLPGPLATLSGGPAKTRRTRKHLEWARVFPPYGR